MIDCIAISEKINDELRAWLAAYYRIDNQARWLLTVEDNNLTLINANKKLRWCIDLCHGKYRHRQQFHSKEPLLKAIRINGKLPQSVLDTTAGALKDAHLMASRGIAVTCIERNPLLYRLQQFAISKADAAIKLILADATTMLSEINCELIYIDPMYPPSDKKAQVKKEMQVLHEIIGQDADADLLLIKALQTNKRIVVKRPTKAAFLADIKPNFHSQIGNTRYDVYLAQQ